MLDRRQLLAGSLLAGFALRAGRARGSQGALFVSCRIDGAAMHHLTGIDGEGRTRFDLPLPERGHGVAMHPLRAEGVVFARRPGTFAVAFDPVAGVALRRLEAGQGRHFYGHGAFSPDGRTLFTSENDYQAGRGVIGVRDATDGYRQIGELESFGIGPHELVPMPDGATLAVANGGILTHPERGRAKLNLDSMVPSLAYLDLADRKLRSAYRLGAEHHRLSIRHLALTGSGAVVIAMQYEGGKRDRVPLVGLHAGGAVRLLEAPAVVQGQMRQYCGSVAVDLGGSLIAVSAPRGNLVTFWDADGAYMTSTMVADGCGVAPTDRPGEFLISSGLGQVMGFRPQTGERRLVRPGSTDSGWDNHLQTASV